MFRRIGASRRKTRLQTWHAGAGPAAEQLLPWSTLLVNVSGSFALGFLMRYLLGSAAATPDLRAGLTIGFCGAFTTMSTFAYEFMTLMNDAQYWRTVAYGLGSVGGSLTAMFAGTFAARDFYRSGLPW